MLAHAFLTVAATTQNHTEPTSLDQIPLTRNEIRHLIAALIAAPIRDLTHRLRYSTWRRRHQHHAKTCHYQRRNEPPPTLRRTAPHLNESLLEY